MVRRVLVRGQRQLQLVSDTQFSQVECRDRVEPGPAVPFPVGDGLSMGLPREHVSVALQLGPGGCWHFVFRLTVEIRGRAARREGCLCRALFGMRGERRFLLGSWRLVRGECRASDLVVLRESGARHVYGVLVSGAPVLESHAVVVHGRSLVDVVSALAESDEQLTARSRGAESPEVESGGTARASASNAELHSCVVVRDVSAPGKVLANGDEESPAPPSGGQIPASESRCIE